MRQEARKSIQTLGAVNTLISISYSNSLQKCQKRSFVTVIHTGFSEPNLLPCLAVSELLQTAQCRGAHGLAAASENEEELNICLLPHFLRWLPGITWLWAVSSWFWSPLSACEPHDDLYSLVSKLTLEFSYLKVWPFSARRNSCLHFMWAQEQVSPPFATGWSVAAVFKWSLVSFANKTQIPGATEKLHRSKGRLL